VPDCIAAEPPLDLLPPEVNIVQGDKGYDSNAVRSRIEAAGAAPNIPPKSNRRYKPGFSPALYRIGTRLSVCSEGSRTFVALAPDTTDELMCISQRSTLQQPSPTGYESGP
jgi:hypothetical protein